MKFPISMTAGLAGYIIRNKMRPRPEWQKNAAPEGAQSNPFRILPPKTGEKHQPHPMIGKRFPIVLMLEPLHACNLTCTGCGRIREYESSIAERVPLEECLLAVDECGAPVVSICGGEPMMYPQIGELAAGLQKINLLVGSAIERERFQRHNKLDAPDYNRPGRPFDSLENLCSVKSCGLAEAFSS